MDKSLMKTFRRAQVQGDLIYTYSKYVIKIVCI